MTKLGPFGNRVSIIGAVNNGTVFRCNPEDIESPIIYFHA